MGKQMDCDFEGSTPTGVPLIVNFFFSVKSFFLFVFFFFRSLFACGMGSPCCNNPAIDIES